MRIYRYFAQLNLTQRNQNGGRNDDKLLPRLDEEKALGACQLFPPFASSGGKSCRMQHTLQAYKAMQMPLRTFSKYLQKN